MGKREQAGCPLLAGCLTRREFITRTLWGAAAAGLAPGAFALLSSGCRAAQQLGAPTQAQAPGGQDFTPAYVSLGERELGQRAAALREMLRSCDLCPRQCGVNRLEGRSGHCRVAAEPMVASHGPHYGEERGLVGRGGSGTVFLSYCNLNCVFCINYQISQLGQGRIVSVERVADMMLELQGRGCHNINWVTPTHQLPMLVEALRIASRRGLRLPVVYNTGGYESVRALRLLDGIVDIYMPDAKWGDNEVGQELSSVPDYWDRSREGLAEMHRQVGDLRFDDQGLIVRGLLVRHLVFPDDIARTGPIMEFLASLSRDTYVNIMSQYTPTYRAHEFPAINRRITSEEYRRALDLARQAGLHRLEREA